MPHCIQLGVFPLKGNKFVDRKSLRKFSSVLLYLEFSVAPVLLFFVVNSQDKIPANRKQFIRDYQRCQRKSD